MLFGSTLFRGALYAGTLFGPDGTTVGIPPFQPPLVAGGGGWFSPRPRTMVAKRARHEVYRDMIEQDEEDVLMTVLSIIIHDEDTWER